MMQFVGGNGAVAASDEQLSQSSKVASVALIGACIRKS